MSETEFLALLEQNQGIIHKVCMIYRDTDEEREDLFQEIVLQLWKAYPGFRKDSKFSTWMYRIAFNTAISSFRKRSVKLEYHDQLNHMTVADTPNDQHSDLLLAIKRLNNTDKALITLHLDGYKNEEIADIMGVSNGNVRVKLTRIRKKLKSLMREQDGIQ